MTILLTTPYIVCYTIQTLRPSRLRLHTTWAFPGYLQLTLWTEVLTGFFYCQLLKSLRLPYMMDSSGGENERFKPRQYSAEELLRFSQTCKAVFKADRISSDSQSECLRCFLATFLTTYRLSYLEGRKAPDYALWSSCLYCSISQHAGLFWIDNKIDSISLDWCFWWWRGCLPASG